jgi:hypothetical protein
MNGKWNFNAMNIFGLVMVVIYIAGGLYILFGNYFKNYTSEIRIIFGSFLLIYGIYRFVRVYFKLKKPDHET